MEILGFLSIKVLRLYTHTHYGLSLRLLPEASWSWRHRQMNSDYCIHCTHTACITDADYVNRNNNLTRYMCQTRFVQLLRRDVGSVDCNNIVYRIQVNKIVFVTVVASWDLYHFTPRHIVICHSSSRKSKDFNYAPCYSFHKATRHNCRLWRQTCLRPRADWPS